MLIIIFSLHYGRSGVII